jgi:hypothetical protein
MADFCDYDDAASCYITTETVTNLMFNDAVSSSDHIPTNDKIINE